MCRRFYQEGMIIVQDLRQLQHLQLQEPSFEVITTQQMQAWDVVNEEVIDCSLIPLGDFNPFHVHGAPFIMPHGDFVRLNIPYIPSQIWTLPQNVLIIRLIPWTYVCSGNIVQTTSEPLVFHYTNHTSTISNPPCKPFRNHQAKHYKQNVVVRKITYIMPLWVQNLLWVYNLL